MRSAIRFGSVIAAAMLVGAATFGVDPPDVRINLRSGLIETVDATWSGSNYNVRYTVVSGAGQLSTSILLSTNAADDLDPRIAIAQNGDVVVAWWRDLASDAVVYRKKSFASESWTAERSSGAANESNSRARVVYDGEIPWMAYQIQNVKTRSVGVQIIDDDPEPIRAIVATTSYGGDLDIRLYAESGKLWVTWIDSATCVGYADFVHEKQLWSVPAYEPYSADSVREARERIRVRILGL